MKGRLNQTEQILGFEVKDEEVFYYYIKLKKIEEIKIVQAPIKVVEKSIRE